MKSVELDLDFTFKLHDSMTWAQPMTIDKMRYFFTNKIAGLPLNGSYRKGKGLETVCNSCLMTVDTFRARYSYPAKYFFAYLH